MRLAWPDPRCSTSRSSRTRVALLARPHEPYEAALVVLGRLVGAVPSEGDGNNDSAPDAVWIFGTTFWVAWERVRPRREVSSASTTYVSWGTPALHRQEAR